MFYRPDIIWMQEFLSHQNNSLRLYTDVLLEGFMYFTKEMDAK